MDIIGQTVSHYRILEHIGGGGMGVVYRAEDTRLKRPVALKFLPPELTRDAEARERFVTEAQAASALQHDSICTVHDIDQTADGQMFIVMDYYEGDTLRKRIEAGPLPLTEAVRITLLVAEGLAEAHRKGIVHRDVKPANILLTHGGSAKVLDFGLAKLAAATHLTRTGTTMGTTPYMSPEQIRGETADRRADVWALGVVLYEMLTARQPFRGEFQEAVFYSILNSEPPPIQAVRPDLPEGLSDVVARAMMKERDQRYRDMGEFSRDLKRFSPTAGFEKEALSLRGLMKRPSFVVPAFVLVAALVTAGGWLVYRSSKERSAREELLPRIEQLSKEGEISKAFALALEAEEYVPTDPQLRSLLKSLERYLVARTTPEGAHVYIQDYRDTSDTWVDLGRTPLEGARISQAFKRWRVVKAGFEPVEGTEDKEVSWAWDTIKIHLDLDSIGTLPPGMVRIRRTSAGGRDYFLDRYEVTNAEFRRFVTEGGYRRREFWKIPILWDGASLTWEEAMKRFTDRTGRPGPATWELGDVPEGADSLPVGGVSWYEAGAYAEFTGKMLPPAVAWHTALGEWNGEFMLPLANFSARGPRPVGGSRSVSPHGVYDLAGNIKEWIWNECGSGRGLSGGSWTSDPYLAYNVESRPPHTRDPDLGFRCMKTADGKPPPPASLAPILIDSGASEARTPCSDAVFESYKSFFRYTKTDLAARVEQHDEADPAWIFEKVTVNAAYGGERLPIYIWMPHHVKPPFQTVLYFPGISAFFLSSIGQWPGRMRETFVNSGRALVLPVYKGSFERRFEAPFTPEGYREGIIQCSKDLGRALDYLETRTDFDMKKLAYAGTSEGGWRGPIMAAVEPRIQGLVLISGGLPLLRWTPVPELDVVHYAPRAKVPVIMVNGRYDHNFPLETSQKPLYQLLGTPPAMKELVILDAGHDLSANPKHVQAYLDFLDRIFGPTQ